MSETRRFTALIVDDEPVARETVLALLRDEPLVYPIGCAANGREAVELVQELRPDLIFLDVQMPERDGFDVLEALGDDVPRGVIFVTAHDEHALRAFEVHALDYLLKPFGRPRFHAAVQRAVRRLQAEDAYSLRDTLASLLSVRNTHLQAARLNGSDAAGRLTRFAVRRGERTILVDAADVDWIEADRDYVRLHVQGTVHVLAERMHLLEQRLDPRRFHRIHRSVIVALPRVRELRRADDGGGIALLESGVQLRVARNRWSGLEAALEG